MTEKANFERVIIFYIAYKTFFGRHVFLSLICFTCHEHILIFLKYFYKLVTVESSLKKDILFVFIELKLTQAKIRKYTKHSLEDNILLRDIRMSFD